MTRIIDTPLSTFHFPPSSFLPPLLQVILEVACDAFVEVDALVAAHVVALTGIYIEVGLGVGTDTGFEEGVSVLWYYGGVVETDYDLQPALQVFSLVDETGLRISLGVALRGVHITLAVHHLIPFPVDYRSACHSHLKHVGVVGHQAYCHKSSVAPSMHSQAVNIDVRQ